MAEPEQITVSLGWIAVVFLFLSIAFVLNLWGRPKPIAENAPVDTSFVAHPAVRDPLMTARLDKIGFEYNCNACHQNFELSKETHTRIAEHTEIELDHGLNESCYNCHNIDNLETLVDYEGTLVKFETSELLCRKCHGPTYRDWTHGAHGRPSGYWDERKGVSTKTTCVQCHDPHSPAFKPIAPAPRPNDVDHEQEGAHHG